MKTFHLLCILGQFIQPSFGAGSYDVVPFEQMTSTHRVIIGVPSDDILGEGKDSDRVKYRRNKIIEIVDAHVERMSKNTDNVLIEEIQYAFITSMEYGFTQLFPRHTKEGATAAKLDDMLPTPAIRLTNIQNGEKMQPDWPILLSDLPDELDRLVSDYERWQTLSKDLIIENESDQLLTLHSKNLVTALNTYSKLNVMFYAPWCHYSQMMLPKYKEASLVINKAVEQGLVDSGRVALGVVNVDEEGELKLDYNISTYPTLKLLSGGNNKKGSKKARWNDVKYFKPHVPFSGDMGSSADLIAHILSTNVWPKNLNYANLIHDGEQVNLKLENEKTSMNLTTLISKFISIVNIADNEYVKANDLRLTRIEKEDDDQIASYEAKRAVIVFTVFPNDMEISLKSKITSYIALNFAGQNKFVASISKSNLKETLKKLPGNFNEENLQLKIDEYEKTLNQKDQSYIVVVKSEFSSILFHDIPNELTEGVTSSLQSNNVAEKKKESKLYIDLPHSFNVWMTSATWPDIARFDPSAAQGERIQNGPITNLCILIGNEKDFMFDDFKSILNDISNKYVGFAHYLYADQSETRLNGLLGAVGLTGGAGLTEPHILVVSMKNDFKPLKLSGNKISIEAMSQLIESKQKSVTSDEL